MGTVFRALIALSLLFSTSAWPSPFSQAAEADQASLDSPDLQPVGIVGFSFRYFGGAYPLIADILPEGPAAKLDIKPQDELLAINGKDIALNSAHETRLELMGAPGSTVELKLRRAGKVFEISLNRLSSASLSNLHLRRAVEHYKLRSHDEAKIPFALAHLAEPGPTVVEFYAEHKSPLLKAKESEGLPVKHIALNDPQYADLIKVLSPPNKEGTEKTFYYFTGIMTDQGFFERRQLSAERLQEALEKIHWNCQGLAVEHFEKLRESSWHTAKTSQSVSNSQTEKLLRQAHLTTQKFLKLQAKNDSGKDMKDLLDGELSLGLPPLGKLTMNSLLLASPRFAVARFSTTSPCPTDIYGYLKHDKTWKITAFRALSCTSALAALRSELQSKQMSGAEQALLAHLNLTLSTDSQIRNWFFKNEAALAELTEAALKLKDDSIVKSSESQGLADRQMSLAEKLAALHLDSINKLRNDNVEIIIGGVGDNSVGLFYSPSEKPPTISPNEYIWVEKITAHWYLFRTT